MGNHFLMFIIQQAVHETHENVHLNNFLIDILIMVFTNVNTDSPYIKEPFIKLNSFVWTKPKTSSWTLADFSNSFKKKTFFILNNESRNYLIIRPQSP